MIHINGEEETVFTDGTVQRVNAQKIKTIDYANGQRVFSILLTFHSFFS